MSFYFAPGTGFHYSNTNYELLGLIVEKQSGTALDNFLAERISKPLGITSTILAKADKLVMPSPHGRGYLFGTNVDGTPSRMIRKRRMNSSREF